MDALPYVDDVSADARAAIDALIDAETRTRSRRVDGVEDDAATTTDAGAGSMDLARCRLDRPVVDDLPSWTRAIANAEAQLEHQRARVVNLELATTRGVGAWRARCEATAATLEAFEAAVASTRTRATATNAARKLQQEAAKEVFGALEREWYATTRKCAAMEGAIGELERRLGRDA